MIFLPVKPFAIKVDFAFFDKKHSQLNSLHSGYVSPSHLKGVLQSILVLGDYRKCKIMLYRVVQKTTPQIDYIPKQHPKCFFSGPFAKMGRGKFGRTNLVRNKKPTTKKTHDPPLVSPIHGMLRFYGSLAQRFNHRALTSQWLGARAPAFSHLHPF